MEPDEKTCPMCAETVKKAAQICKHCGHKFEAVAEPKEETPATEPSGTEPSGTGKKIGIGCLAVLGLFLLVGMCAPGDDKGQVSNTAPAIAPATVPATESAEPAEEAQVEAPVPAPPQGDWTYSRQRDELRGKTEYYANIRSENSVNFDFPYSGGSTLRMTVRRSPQYGEDVIFRISKGQFVCGVYDCTGAISFDGQSERLTLATPADHSSDVLFAKYGGAIIRKLKSSERTIVELPFYQEGNRQFRFDTANLEWPPKD